MKSLTTKYFAISGIVIVLMILASFVRSLGDERRQRRDSVVTELAASSPIDQEIGVPYVHVPYVQIDYDDKGKEVTRLSSETGVTATTAKFTGQSVVTERRRGIFRAQAYDLALSGEAEIALPAIGELPGLGEKMRGREFRVSEPYLILPISTRKGLTAAPELSIDGFKQPIPGKACPKGFCFHPGLPFAELAAKMKRIRVTAKVAGLEQFKFATSAVSTTVDLRSNWPSPSFGGEFLPTTREIGETGFTASWNLYRNSGEVGSFAVRFVDPVDVYVLTDRAAKHAILFILCVFVGFFAVEVFRRVRLHAIQYGLVGASLVVFYLLVLSLSEHVPFAAAYFASVTASIALIRFYLSGVLRHRRDANLFAAALLGLYGLLFAILSAEDFALLLGTALVFGLLVAVMALTRKTDWFRIEKDLGQEGGAPGAVERA